MRKLILVLTLLLAGAGIHAQSNGNGNGNLGTNGAAGQEIQQSIVTQIAQKAAPIFGVSVGYIIHQYHIAECQIICIDPATKAYRVTLGGASVVILVEDGF